MKFKLRICNHSNEDSNITRAKENKSVAIINPKLRIPDDVVIEILSWLPWKTLLRFKCICKLWFGLITSNSLFSKLHCTRVLAEGVRKLEHVTPSEGDFIEDIYECFYRSHRTYSLQNFVRHMNASGFIPLSKEKVSFCHGHYVIDAKIDVLSVITILRSIQAMVTDFLNTNIVPDDIGYDPSLVLVPTNEAAQQFKASSPFIHRHIHLDECSVLEGRYSLLSGKNIIIGTPDFVFKILPKDFLIPDCIKEITLYKTDELFARGFKEEIYNIFKLLPKNVRVVIKSERIPREALEIPHQFWNRKLEQWNVDTLAAASEKMRKSTRKTMREELLAELSKACRDITKQKRTLQEERMKRANNEKKLLKMQGIEKSNKREYNKQYFHRREKFRTSWNPHLKMRK